MAYIEKGTTKNRKDRPSIHARDMYGYIGGKTGLTKKQVMSCFQTYYEMLYEIVTSDCVNLGLKIPLPHVGAFYFSKTHGKKKGSTYGNVDYINGISDQKSIVREYDDPDYYALKFAVYDSLKRVTKQNTMNYEVK